MHLIDQLESELNQQKRRYESAIQEIGRLESKLQTHQFDFTNENDILNEEVSLRF